MWWYGFGRGWCLYHPPFAPFRFRRRWWRRYQSISKDQEREYLENYKKELELKLEDIKKRLEELK